MNDEILKKYIDESYLDKAEGTKSNVHDILLLFFHHVNKPINKISKQDVVKYFNDLYSGTILSIHHKKLSPYTVELRKIRIKHFFKWYYHWNVGEKQPDQVAWIRSNRKCYKFKTSNDMVSIDTVKNIIRKCNNPRDKAIIALLYDGALRVGELTNLKIGDIIHGDKISVVVDGKTGQREIPLNFSIPYIEDYLKTHPCANDSTKPLFITRNGTKIKSRYGIEVMIRTITRKLKIDKNITPHIFRHSRITELTKKGVNESILRRFAGWSNDSKMPSVYCHLDNQVVQDTIYKLDGYENTVDEQIKNGVEEQVKKYREEMDGMTHQINDLRSIMFEMRKTK